VARFLLALSLAGFASAPAYAHGLRIFAAFDGSDIAGKVTFSDEDAVANARVQAVDPDGQLLAETRTANDGSFSIPFTRLCDHTLVAETADGHRAEDVVTATELFHTESSPKSEGTPADQIGRVEAIVEEAVARQILPLREQLDTYENRVRFRDILGGLGYIVGAMGLVALIKARRNPV